MYKDRIVFITGASGGIGRTLVSEYAKTGAKVIAADLKEFEFNSENVEFYKMDLKSQKSIEEVFEKVKGKYAGVDILINNGAVANFNKSIFDIGIEEFDEVIAVNLRGSFICSKKFLDLNKGRDYGRIVNIASTRWSQGEAGWEAYGASKGAIVSLSKTMAVSLSETKITVNCISPGWIEAKDYAGLREIDHKQHPSGRVGRPADIARACLFLTDLDNDFINGENIVVDGGMSKKMIYEE